MSGGSAVIHKQNKYMRIFSNRNAVDEMHPIALSEVGIRRRFIFRRMEDRGVFVECRPGYYYMDLDAMERFRMNRRIKAIALTGVFMGIALICSWFGIH